MIRIEIRLKCPHFQSTSIIKNGKIYATKQNYLCKGSKQFIGGLDYKGCYSQIKKSEKAFSKRNGYSGYCSNRKH